MKEIINRFFVKPFHFVGICGIVKVSHKFYKILVLRRNTLVKSVRSLNSYTRKTELNLCDNCEGVHFFGVSLSH